MLPVNVVWGFSRFVGSIKESCVFRILQQKLADPSVSSPHRNMNRCIPTLPRGERGRDERVRRMKSKEVVKKERGKRRGGKGVEKVRAKAEILAGTWEEMVTAVNEQIRQS